MASSRTSKSKGSRKASKKASSRKSTSRGKTGARKKSGRSASSAKRKAGARSKSTTAKKRGSGKRDLVKTPTGNFFAHREADGSFREMDEVGRSLAADRRQKAKTRVTSGYGDRGDR